MIYTLTLNPALDKTVVIPSFAVDQVNRVNRVRLDPGGKGINVSKMIASLGGDSLAIAALGGVAGEQWKRLAEECGLAVRRLPAKGNTRTNLKIVDPLGHTNTDINEPGASIPKIVLEDLLRWMKEALREGDVLVMSGSVPPSMDQDIYGRLTVLCHDCGARAIVDAEGPLLKAALAAHPDLVKPNHHELAAYVNRPLHTVEEMIMAAEQMMEEGAEAVLVSMGPEGALLCRRAGVDETGASSSTLHVRAPQVSVVSTVGAGDSMVGAVAYGLERGMSWEEILPLAVAAGTAAVACEGSQAPEARQIREIQAQVACL